MTNSLLRFVTEATGKLKRNIIKMTTETKKTIKPKLKL